MAKSEAVLLIKVLLIKEKACIHLSELIIFPTVREAYKSEIVFLPVCMTSSRYDYKKPSQAAMRSFA